MVTFLGTNTMAGLVGLLYIIWSISDTLMLLWEGDPPELKLDLRGMGVHEFLSLWQPDVSSAFSYCHWLSCWCSFNHIWTAGVHIQVCSCIDSTQGLFWGRLTLGGMRGSASLFPQAQSALPLDQPGRSPGLLRSCPLQTELGHLFLWIGTGCTDHVAILAHVKLLSRAECLHTHPLVK